MKAPVIKLAPKVFLERAQAIPVIDVRSPKEFLQGHIPQAHNMPLFTNEERAIVGTVYSRQGKDKALLKGLEIVGPKMTYFVQSAREIAPGNEVLVHCWRGGMRSEAMAWLLDFAGFETRVLEGGYKAYRNYTRQSFLQGPEGIILGGMTGSGKTELLGRLAECGAQVLDLENLAHHKGSAFGALGQTEQPTNEQFENDLAAQWLALDPDKPVWIEDESRNIGKVIIPEAIFNKMSNAQVVFVDIPFDERVERLVDEYGCFAKELLSSIIEKIRKRIGGDSANSAMEFIENGDIKNAIAIVLKYYDKTYQYGLAKRDEGKVTKLSYKDFQRRFKEFC